jgi:hypothetical protein
MEGQATCCGGGRLHSDPTLGRGFQKVPFLSLLPYLPEHRPHVEAVVALGAMREKILQPKKRSSGIVLLAPAEVADLEVEAEGSHHGTTISGSFLALVYCLSC